MENNDNGHEIKEPSVPFSSGSEARTIDDETEVRLSKYANLTRYPNQGKYTLYDFLELPDDTNADLIDGVIYDRGGASAVHQKIVFYLARKFDDFIDESHGSCQVLGDVVDVQPDPSDDKTFFQPDLFVVCDKNKIKDGGEWISGAPDLVVEVLSKSTRTNDMGRKLWKYHDSGVREYWIIDPDNESVIVYSFINDEVETYDFTDQIPVGIWDGYLIIDFAEIKKKIENLK